MDELFSNMFYSIAHWRPEEFELKLPNGHIDPALPFSNIYLTVAMTLGYYAMILILQFVMKNQKPFSLRPLFALHNGMLSFCSLVLLVLIMQNLIPLWSGGWWYAICTGEKYPNYNKLHLLYYINYLFKYYELLDTVFLVLSKKHLEFLHWYHHSMTLWLTFSQLYGQSTVQWVPIVLNLMVHVLMYYYYCRSALGAQVPILIFHYNVKDLVEEVLNSLSNNPILYRSYCDLLLHDYLCHWAVLLSFRLQYLL